MPTEFLEKIKLIWFEILEPNLCSDFQTRSEDCHGREVCQTCRRAPSQMRGAQEHAPLLLGPAPAEDTDARRLSLQRRRFASLCRKIEWNSRPLRTPLQSGG